MSSGDSRKVCHRGATTKTVHISPLHFSGMEPPFLLSSITLMVTTKTTALTICVCCAPIATPNYLPAVEETKAVSRTQPKEGMKSRIVAAAEMRKSFREGSAQRLLSAKFLSRLCKKKKKLKLDTGRSAVRVRSCLPSTSSNLLGKHRQPCRGSAHFATIRHQLGKFLDCCRLMRHTFSRILLLPNGDCAPRSAKHSQGGVTGEEL